MRRIAGILAIAVLAVAALLTLFIALIPREAIKTQIGREIAGWTGREVSSRGDPRIDVFPSLSVTLNDVEVSGPDGMEDAVIISMDRLTGHIRLAPLIIGRVEVESFAMVRPRVHLVRDEEGRRNWAFDTGAAALQLAFAGDVPLGIFRLQGGTIVYEDRLAGDGERFDSVDLTLEWTSVRTPLSVSGSGIWRGEQVMFNADAEAPFGFLNGAPTPFEARIESAPISMIFTGEAQDYPLPQMAGAVKLSTTSLRRFANWLGDPIGPGSTLGPASLFGTADFHDGVLSVADAEVTLDGNSASGALKVTAAATPDVTGTLAFEALDLTPYFAGLSTALSTASDWRGVTLPTEWLSDLSADIRLSAQSVALGDLAVGNTAASVALRDGRLEIGLARADIDGGSLAGDVAVEGGRSAALAVRLRATDIDLADAGRELGLPRGMAGKASVVTDLATTGRDLGAMLDALGGTARFSVGQGAVPSFGLARLAADAGLAAAPGSVDDLAPMPVLAAEAGLNFASGVAVLEAAALETDAFVAEAEGWVALRDGALGLNGTLKAAGTDAGTESDAATAFAIDGKLDDPQARLLLR